MSSGAPALDATEPRPGESVGGFVLERAVANTNHSVVFKAKSAKTDETYALKFIKAKASPPGFAENEVSLMKELNSPHIVKCLQSFDYREYKVIVMPYACGGSLSTETCKLDEKCARIVVRTALKALEYLHGMGIWHRDIKVENFLIFENSEKKFTVKLGDMGLAKKFAGSEMSTEAVGTLFYAPPEILKGERYDKSVDVWSLGVTMYALLSGTLPFPTSPECELRRCIMNAAFFFPSRLFKQISKSAKNLIEAMLVANPAQRISVHDALNHPWFSEDLA